MAGGSTGATVGIVGVEVGVGMGVALTVVVDPDAPRSNEPSLLQSAWGLSMMRTSGRARLPGCGRDMGFTFKFIIDAWTIPTGQLL